MSAPSSRMRPRVGRTKPEHEVEQRRLARPRRADEGDGLARAGCRASTSCTASRLGIRSTGGVTRCERDAARRPASTARLPSFCSRSGSCSTSAIERTDSRPRAPTGMSMSSCVRPWVSSAKYVESSTTSPGVIGRMPVSEKTAARHEASDPQQLHRDPRDRGDVAVEHVEVRAPPGGRRRRRARRA